MRAIDLVCRFPVEGGGIVVSRIGALTQFICTRERRDQVSVERSIVGICASGKGEYRFLSGRRIAFMQGWARNRGERMDKYRWKYCSLTLA